MGSSRPSARWIFGSTKHVTLKLLDKSSCSSCGGAIADSSMAPQMQSDVRSCRAFIGELYDVILQSMRASPSCPLHTLIHTTRVTLIREKVKGPTRTVINNLEYELLLRTARGGTSQKLRVASTQDDCVLTTW